MYLQAAEIAGFGVMPAGLAIRLFCTTMTSALMGA